jgi:hypothetical protein
MKAGFEKERIKNNETSVIFVLATGGWKQNHTL